MPLAICIREYHSGGGKISFYEGREYNYYEHETIMGGQHMYSVTPERKDYTSMFHCDKSSESPTFSHYFKDKKQIREKKIKYLLVETK